MSVKEWLTWGSDLGMEGMATPCQTNMATPSFDMEWLPHVKRRNGYPMSVKEWLTWGSDL